jgi:hypothetical protein
MLGFFVEITLLAKHIRMDFVFCTFLWIRIHQIHMFLGLPDPDPPVRDMDPDPDLDPSINMQNSKKNLDSYYFVALFDFLSLKNDVNGPSKSNKQKKLY